ncbi:protein jag [Proteiniclasticum sp. SCR006]|uniref:RNA-binding protein KhpB n=1 Tax=Proteiniclasticum aestuarii TaxID=2817862 RepID=A0A939HC61_9CLOT|nr:RNA-binding cell elongation regulator Jag/EloR [Proteiniclasticum aestuarii]MBO1265645.1 protein jag [Proteiniclasticum aestuarii]
MNSMQFSGKNVEEAIANALRELNVTEDKITYEVIEEGTKGLLGLIGTKPAIIEVTMKPVERDLKVEATRFLAGIFENMDITAEMDAVLEDNLLKIDISGPKMGLVIGYRGETLDSLQYLTSLVVNKKREGEYVRVILDTEGYRKKREETLERLAEKTAYKVKKYRRSMKLEPMNPYERRIIHSKLQKIEGIATHSVGDEPFRRVVIELDK